MFREAKSSPRAKFEEYCELREIDNVQGQISGHFLKSNMDYCVYYPCYPFQIIFLNTGDLKIGEHYMNIPQLLAGHIPSRDAFTLTRESENI